MSIVWTVVAAAGSGSRFGGRKQFVSLGGRQVVEWSLAAARTMSQGTVLVLPEEDVDHPDPFRWADADRVVAGGPSRSDSVRRGLAAVPAAADVIVVHDAARPLAGARLFRAVLEALEDPSVAGAVCAIPVVDTVKRISRVPGAEGGSPPRGARVIETLDRTALVAVQTPQAFRADVLRRAHAAGGEATDDAGLVEALGMTVVAVAGDPDNIKITTPADLERVTVPVGP